MKRRRRLSLRERKSSQKYSSHQSKCLLCIPSMAQLSTITRQASGRTPTRSGMGPELGTKRRLKWLRR